MKKSRAFKKDQRVCDVQGTRWGTVDSSGETFTYVVWDADIKGRPRKTLTTLLRSDGEKHLFLTMPYKDPKKTQ